MRNWESTVLTWLDRVVGRLVCDRESDQGGRG